MSENKVKSSFHLVTVYAVGQLRDDDTHYFEAFFTLPCNEGVKYVSEI